MDYFTFDRDRTLNIFAVYKRRALGRLQHLKRRFGGSAPAIATHLYNDTRCGIAHGSHGIKVNDSQDTLEQVAKDAVLLKLLARMAIEDKAPRP